MAPGERILICAISGRALAQSARAGGFVPVVLDRFGDDDTRLLAAACDRIAVLHGGRLGRLGPAPDVLADPSIADVGLDPVPADRSPR